MHNLYLSQFHRSFLTQKETMDFMQIKIHSQYMSNNCEESLENYL